MSEVLRRHFLKTVGLGSVGVALGPWSTERRAEGGAPSTAGDADYMHPIAPGRLFASLDAARGASPKPGDVVLVRDLSTLAPASVWTERQTRGKWQMRAYRLADGQSGRLLAVYDWAKDKGPEAVPPEFEVKLDLPGWYAIWLGVPTVRRLDAGIDAALDTDPTYVRLWPEHGNRKGKTMGPSGVEVFCYWKCAQLDGRTLRLRVPYGTFTSEQWGRVTGSVSSLRLLKLNEAQAEAYRKDVSNPATKRVIVICDGFSHYWEWGEPGKGIDARFVQSYRQSDVKMLFLQSPTTGAAAWPSRVTSLLGEGALDADWKVLRRGDRRSADYVRWAIANGQEGMKVVSQLCRQAGLEFHFSLRMNLVMGADDPVGRFFNGRFWREHPELRKPGSNQFDYGQPAARRFVVDLITEVAGSYDPVGVNLDFTRWPPVADPSRHDLSVLTGLLKEVRQALDKVSQAKARKIVLSANVVDGFHARSTLAQQKIDLEAWLASRTLDFICVEARDHAPYIKLAKQYNTPYYVHQDNEPPLGQANDPDWQADHDPLPGEELMESTPLNNYLHPTEWEAAALAAYRQGAAGICVVNHFDGGRPTGRLGHVDEMPGRIARKEVWGQLVGSAIQIEKTV
jgi:hypothetical protein